MDDPTMLTQEETDFLMDLLWLAKNQAEKDGEPDNAKLCVSIAEKIDEQSIANGYAT